MMEMRQVFAKNLEELMRADERICVLDADLSKANGTAKFKDMFPERAFNVGVAEQNMASVAAGMSSYGLIPFITTFTPFASRRIADQLMISIAYAKQNVKIIATDPGITAEYNGGTHMSFEDVGIVRSMPSFVIFEPVDNRQLEQALPQIVAHYGPVWVRMGRKVFPDIFGEDYKFNLFTADIIKEGTDITIFATGIMVAESLKAIEVLKEKGINVELVNVHTIKPIDRKTVVASAKKTKRAVVCENHNIIGGLYSAVAEVLSEEYPIPMKPVGIKDRFGQVGKVKDLIVDYEMTASHIVDAVLEVMKK
jgi:transketolase